MARPPVFPLLSSTLLDSLGFRYLLPGAQQELCVPDPFVRAAMV